jgi:hypothetical protein
MGDKDRWLYRGLILVKALQALGIDAQWLLKASKPEMEGLIFESPEIILQTIVVVSLREKND